VGELNVEITPSDFRKVEGISMSHKQVVSNEFENGTILVQAIKFNVEIPEDKFALPDEIRELAAKKSDK
jgi:hypothetical protein